MSKKGRKGGGALTAYHNENGDKIKMHLQKYKALHSGIDWMYAELMVDHIKDVDHHFRRMKNTSLFPLVEAEIDKMREALERRDFSETDSFDEDGEFERQPDTNVMNRLIVKQYAQHALNNPAPPTPASIDPIVVEAPEILAAPEEAIAVVEPTTTALEKKSSKRSAPEKQDKSKKRKVFDYSPPSIRYADLGGIEQCIDDIRELIEAPLRHPEIYAHLNILPPRGVLLHGPPGCGKTMLARAVAGELGVPFIETSAPSLVSGMSGESEKKIRELFAEAKELAPCIVFLDEIDVITPKRETASREMERRIVAQLLTCMDDLATEAANQKPVIVIGATNRPDALDHALRRAGRFDREISLGIPDESARVKILKVLTEKLRVSGDFDLVNLAKLTPGYVGADLSSLTTAAGVIAVKRIFGQLVTTISPSVESAMEEAGSEMMAVDSEEPQGLSEISRFLLRHPDPLTEAELAPLSITTSDFAQALKKVQPSSKREGFATVPGVSWEEIGALSTVREELRLAIVEPIKNPELFAKVGIVNPSGVLLWGPPGCGKTLLAKAVANESHCNFISVKGPELLDKYVGESERGVRQLFARARASSPCVIFFDELDALCPKRGGSSDSSTTERVVNQLLTEMDGLEGRKNVYIIAATNRPDIIDRAVLRPGRFDKLVMVRLPEPEERHDILKTLTAKMPLEQTVDLDLVARDGRCDRFSGADLSSLIREAGLAALKEALRNSCSHDAIAIRQHHFEEAFSKVTASVTPKDVSEYLAIEGRLLGNTTTK